MILLFEHENLELVHLRLSHLQLKGFVLPLRCPCLFANKHLNMPGRIGRVQLFLMRMSFLFGVYR